MEATTALGLAGNIVQFLDFSQKLCSTFFQIWQSANGLTKNNADTEFLVKNFSSSLDSVSADLAKYRTYLEDDVSTAGNKEGDADRGEMQTVVDGCREVASDLLDRLERLKAGKKSGKWKSLLAAVKAMWKEKELLGMEKLLRRFRSELQWTVVVSLRRSLDLLESRQKDQFERLQSSMSEILSELIHSNMKALPEWSIATPPRLEPTLYPQTTTADHHVTVLVEDANTPRVPIGGKSDMNYDYEQQGLETRLAREYAAKFARTEETVLDSLVFPIMRDRETEIATAEASTFDWIFRDPRAKDRPWSNFQEWLASDSSTHLYWINGKAGSGKSTLMKYLVRHSQTKAGLTKWAGETKLLISSFFFWYSGQELQKSQIGLLRALLYSCFKNHRELIPIVAPGTASLDKPDLKTYWTLPKLREALERLVSQTFFDIKFCFFIDGLDEYSGSHGEIADILKHIASYSNVKVCTSSRPLIAFERAFESFPHLILQNLTFDDISSYVNNKLRSNDRMNALELEEEGLLADITSSIVAKASGVFLWVYLVVGSLLDGLGNYDVGVDLKRRLDDLPEELEALYWHMIERVKPVWYLEEGFRLLRMVKVSSQEATLLRLCFAEMPAEFAHSQALMFEPPLSRQQSLCRDMAGRLKSRCLGLLEVVTDDDLDVAQQSVSFIHKSVFDFLETDIAQSRILACPGQDTFVPEVAFLRGCLLEIKTIPTYIEGSGDGRIHLSRKDWFEVIRPLICQFMRLAQAAEDATATPHVRLMKELQKTVDELWASVEPRTVEEEHGTVHWISAPKLSAMAVDSSLEDFANEFNRGFLDYPAEGIPGNIRSFDEFCQRAGLVLYATAVGLSPLANVPGERSGREQLLMAAEEVSRNTRSPQPGMLSSQSVGQRMHGTHNTSGTYQVSIQSSEDQYAAPEEHQAIAHRVGIKGTSSLSKTEVLPRGQAIQDEQAAQSPIHLFSRSTVGESGNRMSRMMSWLWKKKSEQ
ncbi:hypothetical protein EDB81DRAFT_853098 [Dactylonectria macrodidyma]|uniref:NACHT domain-containing protein n=1 Tax=Dactylonectria macrodidyma TaxID=307937 RepID=A0A9P9FNG4_9HYPO|nr:hypothetical protein EDB81DRAFT_853098 [Dactylonectria macrodidyma]